MGNHTPRGAAQQWLDELIAEPGEGCRSDWPFSTCVSGRSRYPVISRGRRPVGVSRIVCEHFHGAPPVVGDVVRHGPCHDSMCLQPAHLAWGSQVDNALDTIRDGTWKPMLTAAAKLTETQVLEIVDLLDRGLMPSDITPRYVVSQKAIERIRSGRSWNWLTNRRPPTGDFQSVLASAAPSE